MQFGPQHPAGRLISLTPLIDVVFILLVFFMLAASYLDWRAVDLNISSGTGEASSGKAALLIGLAADGSASVDGAPVEAAALRDAVAAKLAPDRALGVVIEAAPGVPLQRAIDALDLVRALGATNVALARRR